MGDCLCGFIAKDIYRVLLTVFKIPFQDFVKTTEGNVFEKQGYWPRHKIQSVGMSLIDGIPGPFEMCIDKIWVRAWSLGGEFNVADLLRHLIDGRWMKTRPLFERNRNTRCHSGSVRIELMMYITSNLQLFEAPIPLFSSLCGPHSSYPRSQPLRPEC